MSTSEAQYPITSTGINDDDIDIDVTTIPLSNLPATPTPCKPIPTTYIPIFPLPPLPPILNPIIRQKVFSHTSLFKHVNKGNKTTIRGVNGRRRAVFEYEIGEVGGGDYEKLEFVGDSILGFIVSTWLHETKPRLSIGTATKLKSFLVSNATLAHLSTLYFLPDRLSADPIDEKVVKAQMDVRAALFEAYIAGIYHSYSLTGQRSKGIDILDKWLREVYSPLAEYFYTGMQYEYRMIQQISSKGPNGEDTTEYDTKASGFQRILEQAATNHGLLVIWGKDEKIDFIHLEDVSTDGKDMIGNGNIPKMVQVQVSVENGKGEVLATGQCTRFHRKKAKDGAAWQAAIRLGVISLGVAAA